MTVNTYIFNSIPLQMGKIKKGRQYARTFSHQALHYMRKNQKFNSRLSRTRLSPLVQPCLPPTDTATSPRTRGLHKRGQRKARHTTDREQVLPNTGKRTNRDFGNC